MIGTISIMPGLENYYGADGGFWIYFYSVCFGALTAIFGITFLILYLLRRRKKSRGEDDER
jgi:uncharacterized membrane protein